MKRMRIGQALISVELTEDGNYRPDRLIIDGELCSMTLYAENHSGKNWTATANGNILYYQSASGTCYGIPQEKIIEMN